MIEQQPFVNEAVEDATDPVVDAEDLLRQRLVSLAPLRTIEVPDFRELVEDDPMAMTFVVNTERVESGAAVASEQDVLKAVATTVASVMTSPVPETHAAVEAWCRGRIRKLVKRARANAWQRLYDNADLVAHSMWGEANVLGFRPRPLSQMSAELRKLQVQGLQFERAKVDTAPTGPHLQIQLADSLGMSTGKAAAQVGHAAQLFLMRAPLQQVTTWLRTSAVQICYVSEVAAEYEIRDAGFTEVAAGSLTAGSSFVTV